MLANRLNYHKMGNLVKVLALKKTTPRGNRANPLNAHSNASIGILTKSLPIVHLGVQQVRAESRKTP
jgi:hypothetical protein